MAQSSVMDITTICQSFPALPDPELKRDVVLATLEGVFEHKKRVYIIDGIGMGKTILLAQFAIKHNPNVVCLFIKSTNRWGYDPTMLQWDMGNQLEWFLRKRELSSDETIDLAFIRKRTMELHRRIQRSAKSFYFIVDGLCDIPQDDTAALEVILDMLPFDKPGFTFLLSGDNADSLVKKLNLPKDISVRPFALSPFTLVETKQYLAAIDIGENQVKDIYDTCQGVPARIASVRRILESGVDVYDVLHRLPQALPNLFEIEWKKVDVTCDLQMTLLAILAHDSRNHTIETLADIYGVEESEVQASLDPLRFVVVNSITKEVRFISETFRQFATEQLHDKRKRISTLLIDTLVRDPASQEATSYLPLHYEQTGRYDDLFNYLSSDTIVQILKRSESLVSVRRMMRLGVYTASRLGRDADLMRCSMQQSALEELAGAEVWRSEVTAYMALKDYVAAMSLAQNTVSREDRLHLLAVIAKIRRKQALPIEEEVNEQIRYLYNQIDIPSLGTRAGDIASDLLYSHPDLAIEMIKKTNTSETGENALDWALTDLSIVAVMNRDDDAFSDNLEEDLYTQIQSSAIRRFSKEITSLLKGYSGGEIIAEVEQLEQPSYGIYLLRQWTNTNRTNPAACMVIDFALNYMIKTTAYVPNIRDLREIAAPLPHAQDSRMAQLLVGRIDRQKETIIERTATEDYVRLETILAETEATYDSGIAHNRVIELYQHINAISDLATKTECLAYLTAALVNIDPQRNLEASHKIHSTVEHALKTDTQALLRVTSEHYQAIRGIIRALVQTRFNLATEFAGMLNVELRRDFALHDVIEMSLNHAINKPSLVDLIKALEGFANVDIKDDALLQIMEILPQKDESVNSPINGAFQLIDCLKDIQNADTRSKSYCMAYLFLHHQDADRYKRYQQEILRRLREAWEAIDIGWRKVNRGFWIVSQLAPVNPLVATDYLHETETFRKELILDTEPVATSYTNAIRLAMRAYSGLFLRGSHIQDSFMAIQGLIEVHQSYGEQAILWGEFALYHVMYGKNDTCKTIVQKYIRPLLHNISNEDRTYKSFVVREVAPALYMSHQLTAFETIEELASDDKDMAYQRIIQFLLRRQLPNDPYDDILQGGRHTTYEDLTDICHIIDRMEVDFIMYYYIKAVIETVGSKKAFTAQQRADIAGRLEEIVNRKFPNARYIQHDGYKIAAKAVVERVRKSNPQVWRYLTEEARKIDNLSDKVLVLGIIASSMPSKESEKQTTIFKEAGDIVDQIPLTLSRIHSYQSLANLAMLCNMQLVGRQFLKQAMNVTTQDQSLGTALSQHNIINIAYRYDPDFAASLASMIDNDAARERIDDQLRILEMKKAITNKSSSKRGISLTNSEDYMELAWKLLGSLNAKRTNPVVFPQTYPFVEAAAKMPSSQSYIILTWVIQNAVNRFENTNEVVTHLRPMFDATVQTATLVHKMAERSIIQTQRVKQVIEAAELAREHLFQAGERDQALDFLQQWFQHELNEYLIVCDQFFGPKDLELLKLVSAAHPKCRLSILTSRRHHNDEEIKNPQEDYEYHWRRISDEDPPETEIVILGLQSSGKSPIHDRFWLTKGSGLKIGTSFNSLGLTQNATISVIAVEDLDKVEQNIRLYLERRQRLYNGEKVTYNIITL